MATKTDVTSSLQERLALESAEGWTPEEGDTLIGPILSIKASAPNEYGIYPIVTIATENGNVAVHCFHQTLKDALLEQRPATGETIAIAYLGEKESKKLDSKGNKRSYHRYSVVVDRPVSADANAAWDTFDNATEDTNVA